jgi:hypothetical protein
MTRRTPLVVALVTGLVTLTAACGDDDDMNDDPAETNTVVTSGDGSVVPGQDQEPVNTDPADSQVTPTIAP